jgi:hypothetical protein
MKPLLCLIAIVLFSCKQKPLPQQKVSPVADTPKPVTAVRPTLPGIKFPKNKYHTDKDTVYIPTESDDTLEFSRERFNNIINYFPELYSDEVTPPDTTYVNGKISVGLVDSLGNEEFISFGCEACQDNYYQLYAWFLKNKNGIKLHEARRKKLLAMYREINELFGRLYYGGTYYGHQYKRIEGYAEYDIYRYIHNKAHFRNPANFNKQKAKFISSLFQDIGDEVNKDEYLPTDNDKKERRLELRRNVNYLNKEITDYFYLETARIFRRDNYLGP